MTYSVLFLTGLFLIVMHEIDAVRCKEWRIFPGLSMLSEKTGYIVFLIAHIPIFYWLFWQLAFNSGTGLVRIGIDIFLIFHVGLHLLFYKHIKNEFKSLISWIIIAGAGICGFVDLILH